MRIYLAGGVGEHGRNCFLVEGKDISFLVDCGKMAGSSDPWPRLDQEQIRGLDFVFLTHSHADHTGALPWLLENGFTGTIAASAETLEQLPFSLPRAERTEDFSGAEGLRLRYGRSGHCVGSIWYAFTLDGKELLFTGDYIEDSLIYAADLIRNQRADLAVVDCAYGAESRSSVVLRFDCLTRMTEELAWGRPLVLPVPQYGRGLELLALLARAHPSLPFYGDAHFLSQLKQARENIQWCRRDARELLERVTVTALENDLPEDGVCFLSDPQLRKAENRELVQLALTQGAKLCMTGTPEAGSFSKMLIDAGKMELMRYPVHQNRAGYEALLFQNHFAKAIPFHAPELRREGNVIEL